MTHFVVGDRVIVRWGKQQGQTGTIMTIVGDVHKVKIEDGSIGFFTGKGLEAKNEPVQQPA